MINWILRALIMSIVMLACAYYLPNIKISSFTEALKTAVLIAVVNATLGNLLRLFTFPITILTLGLSSMLISVLMIVLVDYTLSGLSIIGFLTYFKLAIILSVSRMILGFILKD